MVCSPQFAVAIDVRSHGMRDRGWLTIAAGGTITLTVLVVALVRRRVADLVRCAVAAQRCSLASLLQWKQVEQKFTRDTEAFPAAVPVPESPVRRRNYASDSEEERKIQRYGSRWSLSITKMEADSVDRGWHCSSWTAPAVTATKIFACDIVHLFPHLTY